MKAAEEYRQLFFAAHSDLCEASAMTSLEDAVAGKESAASVAAQAQDLSDSANAKLAKLNTGAAVLSEKVAFLRGEIDSDFNELAERALTEEIDLDTESRTAAHQSNLLTQLRNILERWHVVIQPRERLAALLAQAVLLTARANVSSYVALEAGILRYEASKPLLDADGSVSYGEQGAAWDAYTAQMHCHRMASEAVAVVEAEQARQRMLAVQGVI